MFQVFSLGGHAKPCDYARPLIPPVFSYQRHEPITDIVRGCEWFAYWVDHGQRLVAAVVYGDDDPTRSANCCS